MFLVLACALFNPEWLIISGAGVPWTEEEHRMFLLGLQKLGKGDWRGIARNYVISRTPTQVASHAQKYFIRQSNVSRRKRRSSLFDIVADEVSTMFSSLYIWVMNHILVQFHTPCHIQIISLHLITINLDVSPISMWSFFLCIQVYNFFFILPLKVVWCMFFLFHNVFAAARHSNGITGLLVYQPSKGWYTNW